MVDKLTIGGIIAVATLMGCSGSSDAPSANTVAEKSAISESKAAWDADKVAAFKKAHAEEGRMTPGEKLSKHVTTEQASK